MFGLEFLKSDLSYALEKIEKIDERLRKLESEEIEITVIGEDEWGRLYDGKYLYRYIEGKNYYEKDKIKTIKHRDYLNSEMGLIEKYKKVVRVLKQ